MSIDPVTLDPEVPGTVGAAVPALRAVERIDVEAPVARAPWHPAVVRWGILAVAAGVAFHETFVSLLTQTYNGDPLAYLFLLPLWAALLAVGTYLQRGEGLAIHDRQVDWVLATALLTLMALIAALLVPRLGPTAGLVRVDVFCLLLFLLAGCTLLFGTRSTGRHWTVWAFLFACCPLLYQVVGAAAGGTTMAYASITLGVSVLVTFAAVGPPLRSRVAGAAMALVIGAVLVAVTRTLPATAAELLPAALAPLAPCGLALRRRLAARPRVPRARPTAVHRPALGAVLLAAVAVAVGTVAHLAPPSIVPSSLSSTGPGWIAGPVVPSGWTVAQRSASPWAPRFFGPGATLTRTWFRPTSARAGASPVVVDVLTTTETGPLSVFPAVSTYRLDSPYVESSSTIRGGRGLAIHLFSANTDAASSPFTSQWVMATWTWRFRAQGREYFQRIDVVGLNGTFSRAGVPDLAPPTTSGSIRSTYADILRATRDDDAGQPAAATVQELRRFSLDLVHRQWGDVR